MDFKQFKQEKLADLPPNLEAGTRLKQITRVEPYTFPYEGKTIDALRVFADDIEYRTTSRVLMEQLQSFFKDHPDQTLDNVKVKQKKKYLTLEEDN